MNDKLLVKKWYATNEDLVYPKCHICSKELSPYFIIEGDDGWLNGLLELGLIHGFEEGKVVAFLCKDCCNVSLVEEE